MPNPAETGQWDPTFPLPDVAVHTHLLPDGTVLAWGRRPDPGGGMHQVTTAPFRWDPATGTSSPVPGPTRADGTPVNLFCSGHAFLPDGRLLVAGGHRIDGDGLDQACTFDHATGTWSPLPVLRSPRWYPTVTTLADGRALVLSGSRVDGAGMSPEPVPEVWDGGWQDLVDFQGLPLYPRMHVAPDGRVAMVGTNAQTFLLDVAANAWSPPVAARAAGERQYAPSVQLDPGRVLYVGGGNDAGSELPAAACEILDLRTDPPVWRPAAPMHRRRRHHNATLLPDGTVLVTGGTGGPGFNDLAPGAPVHAAELYDPATDSWTLLAEESVDRCYHATALLLPDGTVLSAGGGEFVIGPDPNPPAETHRDAQVFRPPYLFRGPRPEITDAADSVPQAGALTVTTAAPVVRATLLRLGSVTHAFDENQRYVPLTSVPAGTTLTAQLPTESTAPWGVSCLVGALLAIGI
uniref:galactose oxidase-like domain-containing protein n=1 Tax=Pseudonocardia pini TaxID=2758030 RepID=UPI0015F0DA10